MSEDTDELKGCLLNFLALGISIILTPFGSFVFKQLWEWFLVPLGVASISIAHAWGIFLLIRYAVHREDYTKTPHSEIISRTISSSLLYPLIGLGLGAVAKWWMGL